VYRSACKAAPSAYPPFSLTSASSCLVLSYRISAGSSLVGSRTRNCRRNNHHTIIVRESNVMTIIEPNSAKRLQRLSSHLHHHLYGLARSVLNQSGCELVVQLFNTRRIVVRAEELQSLIIFLLLNVVTQYKLPVSSKLGIVQKIRDATTRNRENLITSHY